MLLEQAFDKRHSPFQVKYGTSGVVMITPTQHTNILPPQIQQILELLLKFLFKSSWSGWICATSVGTQDMLTNRRLKSFRHIRQKIFLIVQTSVGAFEVNCFHII